MHRLVRLGLLFHALAARGWSYTHTHVIIVRVAVHSKYQPPFSYYVCGFVCFAIELYICHMLLPVNVFVTVHFLSYIA